QLSGCLGSHCREARPRPRCCAVARPRNAAGRDLPCAQRLRVLAGISRAPPAGAQLPVRRSACARRPAVLYVLFRRHRPARAPCRHRIDRAARHCRTGTAGRVLAPLSRPDHGCGPLLALRRRGLGFSLCADLFARPERRMSWAPPRRVLIAWAALLALLGTTIFLAYQPLGNFNLAIALCIAMAKTLIIMAVFMELRERSGLMIAF